MGRDHNATSYSTETSIQLSSKTADVSRDHNATSYSTETRISIAIAFRYSLQRS